MRPAYKNSPSIYIISYIFQIINQCAETPVSRPEFDFYKNICYYIYGGRYIFFKTQKIKKEPREKGLLRERGLL